MKLINLLIITMMLLLLSDLIMMKKLKERNTKFQETLTLQSNNYGSQIKKGKVLAALNSKKKQKKNRAYKDDTNQQKYSGKSIFGSNPNSFDKKKKRD